MSQESVRRKLAQRVSLASRGKKLEWLRTVVEPGSSVLLVGAAIPRSDDLGVDNFVEHGLAQFAAVTALSYDAGDPLLGCPYVRGDACALPFADGTFDYVVSNAVIEHVGGPARARAMLDESIRVSRRGAFHTTPDRWFPVEVHTQVPLLHWLPRRLQHRAFSAVGIPYWTAIDYWLFGRRSLARLDRRFSVVRNSPITLVASWSAAHASS